LYQEMEDVGIVDSLRAAIVVALSEGRPLEQGVAARLGISTRTLQRRVGLRGTTFTRLVRDIRREAACEMLASTQMPLTAIAATLGFSALSSFSRFFRRCYGISPSEFRNMRQGVDRARH